MANVAAPRVALVVVLCCANVRRERVNNEVTKIIRDPHISIASVEMGFANQNSKTRQAAFDDPRLLRYMYSAIPVSASSANAGSLRTKNSEAEEGVSILSL